MITEKPPGQLALEDIRRQVLLSAIRRINLERAEARREALELAARRLEGHHANELYMKALRLGAALIRKMKNEEDAV